MFSVQAVQNRGLVFVFALIEVVATRACFCPLFTAPEEGIVYLFTMFSLFIFRFLFLLFRLEFGCWLFINAKFYVISTLMNESMTT